MLIKDWPDREELGSHLLALVKAQEELWGCMAELEYHLGIDLELEDWVEYAAVVPPNRENLVEAFIRDFGEMTTERTRPIVLAKLAQSRGHNG